MSEADEAARHAEGNPARPVALLDDDQPADEWAELRPVFAWIRARRPVFVGGVALIIAQLAWRALFLRGMYFHQDDFFNLDLAKQSSLSWHYLTFVGVGHFMMGQRVLAWLITRSALYNWGLASVVSLVFVACADLAALRLLRKLFGERPAVLVLLTIYLLYPLALPDFGYWTAATESVPFQLAIFMAVHAHVSYVRDGKGKHLAVAGAWVAFGLVFFEKALILPVLLYLLTAAFLVPSRSLVTSLVQALLKYRKAWALYAVLLAGYAVLLAFALRTAASKPALPHSAANIWTYSWAVVKDTFIPSLVGGPWHWLRAGGAYALASPPAGITWLAMIVVVGIVAATLWRRGIAWRAWAILVIWVLAADMLPVILRRIDGAFPVLFALDTRYLADAAAVLVLCLGLAVLPLAGESGEIPVSAIAADQLPADQQRMLRVASVALFAVFVIGSLWSAQSYANTTSGVQAATYIANATAALGSAPQGTKVVTTYVPPSVYVGFFEKYGLTSTVVGDIEPGRLSFIAHPRGTIDGLQIVGPDGDLHPAFVYGTSSGHAHGPRGCWPVRHDQIVVRFLGTPSAPAAALRIGYIWGGTTPSTVNVQYGGKLFELGVKPGLHAAYLPVTDTAKRIVVTGMEGAGICIGDAEAGNFAPVAG